MLKIRRPLGRLIFNMGNAIPGKTVFLIETAPWLHDLITRHGIPFDIHSKILAKIINYHIWASIGNTASLHGPGENLVFGESSANFKNILHESYVFQSYIVVSYGQN